MCESATHPDDSILKKCLKKCLMTAAYLTLEEGSLFAVPAARVESVLLRLVLLGSSQPDVAVPSLSMPPHRF